MRLDGAVGVSLGAQGRAQTPQAEWQRVQAEPGLVKA
jgi:hypothetical protein